MVLYIGESFFIDILARLSMYNNSLDIKFKDYFVFKELKRVCVLKYLLYGRAVFAFITENASSNTLA